MIYTTTINFNHPAFPIYIVIELEQMQDGEMLKECYKRGRNLNLYWT